MIEQFDPAATEPQVLVSLKSLALVPVIVMPVIVRAPVPPLVSVNAGLLTVVFTVVLLNTSLVVDSVAWGMPVPVPLSDTLCIELATPFALSVTVKAPVSGPVDCGSNVTLIVQTSLPLPTSHNCSSGQSSPTPRCSKCSALPCRRSPVSPALPCRWYSPSG